MSSSSSSSGAAGNLGLIVAKYDYAANAQGEISMKKGEKLVLLDDSRPWWRVQNAELRCGIVPSNYVKRAKPGLFASIKQSLAGRRDRHDKVAGSSANNSGSNSTTTTNSNSKGFSTLQHPRSATVPLPLVELPPSGQLVTSGSMSSNASGLALDRPNARPLSNSASNIHMQSMLAGSSNGTGTGTNVASALLDGALSSGSGPVRGPVPNPPDAGSPPLPPFTNGVAKTTSANGNLAAMGAPVAISIAGNGKQLGMALVKFDYVAQKSDELTLRKNDLVYVLEKSNDGWWRVSAAHGSPHAGWFPSNHLVAEDSLEFSKLHKSNPNIANTHFYNDPAEAGVTQYTNNASAGGLGPKSSSSLSVKPPPPPDYIKQLPPGVLHYVVSLYRFARQHEMELSFEANEYLEVIDKPADDPEWWLARNSMGDTGLIPCNYVQVVNMPASLKTQQQSTTNGGAPTASNAGAGANGGGTGTRTSTSGAHSTTSASSLSPNVSTAGSAAPQLKPRGSYVRGGPFASIAWFWGTITRSEAEHMLISRAVIGEFVVRECESTPGDFTISCRAQHKTRHFRVHHELTPARAPPIAAGDESAGAPLPPLPAGATATGGSFQIGQLSFDSMEDLLEHYMSHPIYRGQSASPNAEPEVLLLLRPFELQLH